VHYLDNKVFKLSLMHGANMKTSLNVFNRIFTHTYSLNITCTVQYGHINCLSKPKFNAPVVHTALHSHTRLGAPWRHLAPASVYSQLMRRKSKS